MLETVKTHQTVKTLSPTLILTTVYHINPLVTIPNFYLVLALYLISTTYKNKVITNVLEKPLI